MWVKTNTQEAMGLAGLENHTVTPTDSRELARLEERNRRFGEPLSQLERIKLRERTVRDVASKT